MRKKLWMLLSLVLLAGSYILIDGLKQQNFYIFNTISPDRADRVKTRLKPVEDLDFTALLCNGTRVPFDDASNTFYVPLDMETAQWEKLEFTSGQQDYEILFEQNITETDKQQVIAAGEKFPLLVYDRNSWTEYGIVFTGLPVIDLATEEGFYTGEEISGSAVFYDTDFSVHGTSESEYQGHVRGNTSRMFPKKGYKLNLVKNKEDGTTEKNKLSLFGMRKDDDWILYAAYNDDTKIRDRLSMEVWDTFGAGAVSEKAYYGTKMTYVEVFADNSYCGLYGLMEPVDAKQMNLAAEDYSYKRKEPGSVKYKYDEFHEASDPYALVQGFEIKEGILDEEADLWEPMADLAAVLTLPDDKFLEQESELVNEESALNLWLLIQIITGYDQIAKNVYYVAKYEEELEYDYQFYFAPWDMDLTWGNVSVGEVNPLYTDFEWDSAYDKITWDVGTKLLSTDYHESRAYVMDLYTKLRNTVLTNGAVEAMILKFDAQLRDSGAFARDEARWPEGAHASDCEQLLNYAKERLDFLDEALYNLDYYDVEN